MPTLILATRNLHKVREFREILGPDFALDDLSTHHEIDEVVEDGASFAENARLKSVTVSRQLPGLILADDSGLEVDSLGGAPGIFSARYAGEESNDAENRRKLLAELDVKNERTARFRCVLSLAQNGEEVAVFEGTVEGEIVAAERGAGGFGYDPLFQPLGLTRTFAELSEREKNQLSHRAAAVGQLRKFLAANSP